MARRTSRKPAGNTVSVDFSDVEVRVLLPEGMYDAVVDEVKLEDNNGKPYLAWKFKTQDSDPKFNDKALYNNTSLQPQSLWVLASLLDCLGVDRPDGAMDLDLEELKGKPIVLQVEHEEYEGKIRGKVVNFMAKTDDDDEEVESVDEDDEDEDSAGGGKYTEEQVNEMDAEELGELVEEHDLGVKPLKKIDRYRANVIAALEKAGLIGEEDEDEDEDDEDEDEEDGLTEESVMEMDADELTSLNKEHKLKVKLTGKIKKDRRLIIDALEEKGLLDGDEDEDDE
jgi:hypothetical protein